MIRAPRFSIILAAGKGTRMQSANCPKVCFPVDGIPAINRAISVYNECGVRRHIIVVGSLAGQVVETVGRVHANVLFAYQAEQAGTADAARVGLRALESIESDADVLLVAGDRLIEPSVVEQLFDLFYSEDCDLALLTTRGQPESSQARLVEAPEGSPLAIVEEADIRQRQVFRDLRARFEQAPLTAEEARELIRRGFSRRGVVPAESKLAAAFGSLWETVRLGGPATLDLATLIPSHRAAFDFTLADGTVFSRPPEEVRRIPWMNNSVYVVKASALHFTLERLNRDNAQGEEYLSNLVDVLAAERGRFRVRTLRVQNHEAVLGYNDPAELLAVESVVRARQQGRAVADLPESGSFRSIAAWRTLFSTLNDQQRQAPIWRALADTYGEEASVVSERANAYQELLDHAARRLGEDARVLLVRSSGRLNVMGRHVDHQGGHCNLMTIGFETLLAVHQRSDDRVRLFNADAAHYADREFSIGDMLAALPWDDWLSLVNSDEVSRMVRTAGGDWAQYFKAAVLRLQKKFPHLRLRGMDVVVSGNIPAAAGLSSSSSLVVAAAEAMSAVNRLEVFAAQFVDLCGEGEWFVGTRGGSADHAAVKLGRRGKVIQVTFFDFAVKEAVEFPEDYVMVVGDSGLRAQKSASARDEFNHRVACYRLGLRLIRRCCPQYAPLIHHLRDVNVRNLRVPLASIYRVLLHLPEAATRDDLRVLLAGEDLEPVFATHRAPADGLYPIRGVVLYGLAECERSRLYAEYLRTGRLADIGRMMRVSHHGDRVVTWSPQGESRPYHAPTSNGHLLGLMEDLESGDSERVERAQLRWQPGGYRCSLPAIDRMVDLANATPGVAGAQLAGAGLGGCMMILVRRDAVPALHAKLVRDYYEPAGLSPAVFVCRPVAGSAVLSVEAT